MGDDAFDVKILAEKLSKLNNSQQSIESLSRWCISHRKKAKQIVETWEKSFKSSQKERRVSFLYLANDILQNSRRTGSEFVNEFWKVLPGALKHVYESGDEYGKKAVSRLVNIWEERKVFGSRGKSLKDEMLGKDPPSSLASNGKSSNPIKIVKRDAQSVRIKLATGALPERILTGFQSVLDENLHEEATLTKCNAAVCHVGQLEENLQKTSALGDQQGHALVDELQQQEDILQQCVGHLESMEASRAGLVLQLKEAIQDQESKLELIRNQLLVARGKIEHVSNIRKRLTSPAMPASPPPSNNVVSESGRVVEQNMPSVHLTVTPPQPLTQPVLSFAPSKLTEEESKKAAAAAMAAKLAASTSSAQMLSSVLSSLVAEEAASMNGSFTSGGFTTGLPIFPPEKRLKLETQMPVSDVSNSDMSSTAYVSPLQPMTNMSPAPSTSMQPMSQVNQGQASFAPTPAPPAPGSHANPTANPFIQSTGLGMMPFGYGGNAVPPPPPPLPPHIAMGLARPTQPLQQPQAQPQPSAQQQTQPQQQPASGGYYRPPGIGFYGQSQPATPQVHRQ